MALHSLHLETVFTVSCLTARRSSLSNSKGFLKRSLWVLNPLLFLAFGAALAGPPPNTSAPQMVLGFIGDSITEGYGVAQPSSYPYLFHNLLESKGINNWQILVDGISGSTSASCSSRLKALLERSAVRGPDVLVLALGANDGLRGLPTKQLKENLEKCLLVAKAQHLTVLLVGMYAPPNLGPKYTSDFKNVYTDLSKKYSAVLMPFLLEGVAGSTSLNQSDGIHPTEKGHQIIAEALWPYFNKALIKLKFAANKSKKPNNHAPAQTKSPQPKE